MEKFMQMLTKKPSLAIFITIVVVLLLASWLGL